MLRRRTWVEVFAAVFFEARWRGDGRVERDAGVFAARGGDDAERWEKAARGVVPTRRGGRIEYRGAIRRTELLPDAAVDFDFAAEERIAGSGGRSWGIFLV